jgi:hypothetical protein
MGLAALKQVLRAHGMTNLVAIAPRTDPVVAAMKQAGRVFQQQRTAGKRAVDLGLPHLWVWRAMIMELLKAEGLEQPVQAALSAHAQQTTSPATLQNKVVVCEVVDAFQDGKCRVTWLTSLEERPLGLAVKTAWQQRGASIMCGATSRPPVEREATELLIRTGNFRSRSFTTSRRSLSGGFCCVAGHVYLANRAHWQRLPPPFK